jgi:flagellar biosynthesis anti-sigma factor FlgM
MKIDNSGLSGVSPDRTDKTGQAQADAAAAGGQTRERADQVQLSNLSETVRVLAGESPERTAKIERLARAVAAGAYHADPAAVGKRIIDDALEVARQDGK